MHLCLVHSASSNIFAVGYCLTLNDVQHKSKPLLLNDIIVNSKLLT